MEQGEYISVTEAARRFGVSRAKVHRLIQQGQVRTASDPRDGRVTLVHLADVARLLGGALRYRQAGQETVEVRDRGATLMAERYTMGTGHLSAQQRARVDAVRARLARHSGEDSVEVLRRERDRRTRALDHPGQNQ